MDLRWQERQRAFQARVLIDDDPALGLRPYRTFLGPADRADDRHTGRGERLVVTLVAGGVLVSLLLAFGLPREFAALAASLTGGIALMTVVSPSSPHPPREPSGPLLAVYPSSVTGGMAPVCVTRISADEFDRLGTEGFGTVVGTPRPGATFGLFVDDHLVWPRTPPRGPRRDDPRFGSA